MTQSLVEALSSAVRSSNIALLTTLLTDPRSKKIISNNQEDNSPLGSALIFGSEETVILLLDAKANPNQIGKEQRTPLHRASFVDREPHIMQRLLDAKANPNSQDWSGKTVLHYELAEMEHSTDTLEKVKLLLAHQADVSLADNEGNTPLHILARIQPSECHTLINLLVAAKADVNKQNKEGLTPLSVGTYRKGNSAQHLGTLLSKNANPMLKDRRGWLAIDHALENQHPAAVKIVAEAKSCDLREPGANGHPALHQSLHQVEFANFQSTAVLLSTGKVDVNQKNNGGDTPLHCVVNNMLFCEERRITSPHAALVQLLLAHKANPHHKDKLGRTPLELLSTLDLPSSKTQAVQKLLLPYMSKQALLTGLLPRPGAGSVIRTASSRLNFDRQAFRIIWASAFVPGLDKRKPPEQQMFLQTLQQFSIDLPETLLCNKSIGPPFSLIYPTSAEATVACEQLRKTLGTDRFGDLVTLKIEQSDQGWFFSISQSQYERLLTLEPKEISGPRM